MEAKTKQEDGSRTSEMAAEIRTDEPGSHDGLHDFQFSQHFLSKLLVLPQIDLGQ